MHARTCAIGALGGAGLLGLVSVANLAAGPFFALSTNTRPLEQDGTKLVGGVQGAIKGADSATATLRVASGFLGLWSVAIVITEDTEIPVDGKLGGIGDLERGQLVRVTYEVRNDRLVARRVDVLDRPPSSDLVTPASTTADALAIAPISDASAEGPSGVMMPAVVAPTLVPPAVAPKTPEKLRSRRPAASPRVASPPKREKTAAAPSKKPATTAPSPSSLASARRP